SLRAPAPLAPIADFTAPVVAAGQLADATYCAAPATTSLADILRLTAILYFYSFLMLFALAAVRHIWFAYRLTYAAPLDEPALEAALETWRRRIGVKRQPRYVFSHIVSSVCVYGFIRPIVVMPYNLLDRISIEDAALMGAHEMAHIKRGDVALFALCSVAKAVFWFNPFMHRICARANLTAEQGADALVLESGVDRRQYAHCFVQGLRLASGARHGFAGELVPSFTPFDKRSRRERLDAILSGAGETRLLSASGRIGLGACAVLAGALAFAQAAFAVAPPSVRDALSVTPVKGEITAVYGKKFKAMGEERKSHEGIDIKAEKGTPVLAAGAGKVIEATKRYRGSDAWGKVVVIDHGHGLVTRYAHLDSYSVSKGDRVDAGEPIGAVGSTGRSTGPHLHFEIISNGETIDPQPIVMPNAALPSPRKKAAAKTTRNVQIASAPPVAIAPPPAPVEATWVEHAQAENAPKALDEKKARKNERKRTQLDKHLRKQFKNFEAFNDLDGVTLRFNELELDGFDGAEDLARMFEKQRMRLKDLAKFQVVLPDMSSLVAEARLSEEEIEELRDQQKDAMREAARAMERVREDLEGAAEARREAYESLREAELERAEEQREWRRKVRELQREREAELKELHREAEREIRQAEREWERERTALLSEREKLERREQSIRNAKESLELELAEIEQRRRELENTQGNR
ncbi:MAG: peptidoglycan DD-metalloendopeptidase family protein, partial [Pseudomonadota bacterium]